MKNIDHITIYANALYSIWNDFDKKDEKILFTTSIKKVYFSFKKDLVIIDILNSNNLLIEEKKEILNSIFEDEFKDNIPSSYVLNFLNILLENHFFSFILDIIISFFEKLNLHQNFIFLRIFSKQLLDFSILKKIEKLFTIKTNKFIRYENIIDENIIGGIKIMFGDQVFDYSIKGRIDNIKLSLEKEKRNENAD